MAKERGTQSRILAELKKRYPYSKFINIHVDEFGNDGEPDIVGCYNGRAVVMEVKQPGEKPDPLQERKLNHWSAAGALVGVVTSVPEAMGLMQGHGKEWVIRRGDY